MPWFWQEPDTVRKTRYSSEPSNALQPSFESSQTQATRSWLNPSKLLHPSTILSAALLTTGVFYGNRVYKTHLRRIPNVSHVKPASFRTRSIFGRVTSVGDADNFRLYHTPGGRLVGWDWARHVPKERKELVDQTLHIRIAGVDAPELPHFGKPGQPFGPPAIEWLKHTVDGKVVRAYPYARDQYGRVVASVKIRKWWGIPGLGTKDLGLEMIKAGWAEVYTAKGAEYGDLKEEYMTAQKVAQSHRVGMWTAERSLWDKFFHPGRASEAPKLESPHDFKARIAKEEANPKKEETSKRKKS